ncbi:DUF2199 domain-containing protein [Tsuneonella sp. HG222]
MSEGFRFKCRTCGEWHEGVPHLSAAAPLYYYGIPEADRERRCVLTADTCVVDGSIFFVRGIIEIPVAGLADPFGWGVWVSLSEAHFREYDRATEGRERLGPYFGWLSAALRPYPETENLKTMLHPRPLGERPSIELEPTNHPLAIEQRCGIDRRRLEEIYESVLH